MSNPLSYIGLGFQSNEKFREKMHKFSRVFRKLYVKNMEAKNFKFQIFSQNFCIFHFAKYTKFLRNDFPCSLETLHIGLGKELLRNRRFLKN